MFLYLVPAWAATLVGLWAYMVWDKGKAIRWERDHCGYRIETALKEVSDGSTEQIEKALAAGNAVVIPDDIARLCASDTYCRDK